MIMKRTMKVNLLK